MRSANFLAENTRIAHFPKGTSAPRMPVIPSASEGLRLSSRKEGRLWKHLPIGGSFTVYAVRMTE
jgi:hypothetical protein